MSIWAIGDLQGCYDVTCRLLEKIKFDPAADFSKWLASVARNHCIDNYRSTRREQRTMVDDGLAFGQGRGGHDVGGAQDGGTEGTAEEDAGTAQAAPAATLATGDSGDDVALVELNVGA